MPSGWLWNGVQSPSDSKANRYSKRGDVRRSQKSQLTIFIVLLIRSVGRPAKHTSKKESYKNEYPDRSHCEGVMLCGASGGHPGTLGDQGLLLSCTFIVDEPKDPREEEPNGPNTKDQECEKESSDPPHTSYTEYPDRW